MLLLLRVLVAPVLVDERHDGVCTPSRHFDTCIDVCGKTRENGRNVNPIFAGWPPWSAAGADMDQVD